MDAIRLSGELFHNMATFTSLLSGIIDQEAMRKPDPGSWSVLQVVCHLLDEERLDFRPRLEITLHHPGKKWTPIDPQGWVIARKYNERSLEDTLAEFLVERRLSLAWLEGLSSPDWEREYEAPFGRIKAGDLLVSWVLHDLLHVRQIIELKRSGILRLAGNYDGRYAGDW